MRTASIVLIECSPFSFLIIRFVLNISQQTARHHQEQKIMIAKETLYQNQGKHSAFLMDLISTPLLPHWANYLFHFLFTCFFFAIPSAIIHLSLKSEPQSADWCACVSH